MVVEAVIQSLAVWKVLPKSKPKQLGITEKQ